MSKTTLPLRNQKSDHLITPMNSVLIVVDFQPRHIHSINTMEKSALISNAVSVAKLARVHKMPAVITTANVTSSGQKKTIPGITTELNEATICDRTTMNAWEDDAFLQAVKTAGRKKLIFIGMWSEVCVSFPVLDALKEGYDVYLVADAVAGTSQVSHDAALQRLNKAGVTMTSVLQLTCELQRDWDREETVPSTMGILRDYGIFLRLD